jgi:hypothetical protein
MSARSVCFKKTTHQTVRVVDCSLCSFTDVYSKLAAELVHSSVSHTKCKINICPTFLPVAISPFLFTCRRLVVIISEIADNISRTFLWNEIDKFLNLYNLFDRERLGTMDSENRYGPNYFSKQRY